jgi:hypothetical protein
MPTTNKKTLIITRKLGFKKISPGLGQWQMLTTPNEECWICGQHVCAVFIWTPIIGEQESINDFMYEDFF